MRLGDTQAVPRSALWLIAKHSGISRLIRRFLMDSLSLPGGSLVFLAPFFPDSPNKFVYSQVNRL